MLEAIVVVFIAFVANGAAVETFGPNERPVADESVPVIGSDGQVLYYNYIVD